MKWGSITRLLRFETNAVVVFRPFPVRNTSSMICTARVTPSSARTAHRAGPPAPSQGRIMDDDFSAAVSRSAVNCFTAIGGGPRPARPAAGPRRGDLKKGTWTPGSPARKTLAHVPGPPWWTTRRSGERASRAVPVPGRRRCPAAGGRPTCPGRSSRTPRCPVRPAPGLTAARDRFRFIVGGGAEADADRRWSGVEEFQQTGRRLPVRDAVEKPEADDAFPFSPVSGSRHNARAVTVEDRHALPAAWPTARRSRAVAAAAPSVRDRQRFTIPRPPTCHGACSM